jgi:RsiW-degrading membrane proteinase PrsW (M82 family)
LQILGIALVAIAPCAFWLWIIYKGDKYKPEPKSLIIRTFFFGMGIAVPVAFIETLLYPGSIQSTLSVSSAAYAAFVVAGITEESAKFLVVRSSVYNSPHFEEPTDGLVYSSAAALGFASLENIIYMITYGWQIILVRGLFSNLAHVLFSSLWGYPLALTKLGMMKHKSFTWVGLVTAMVAHGAFDFLFFTGSVYTYLVIPFFIGMVVLFILMMRHANKISPYIAHRVTPQKL